MSTATPPPDPPSPQPSRLRLFLAFFAVYIVWGSSYLGIRFAIEGIPPAFLSGLRFTVAGLVLLGIFKVGGKNVLPPPRALPKLIGIGSLLLVGNWGVGWAEQFVPSGLAAVVFATAPIWIAAMNAVISPAERLQPRAVVGLFLALGGVTILMWPKLSQGTFGGLRGEVALLVTAIVWSAASVWAKHAALPMPPFVAAAWQMFFGGAVFLASSVVSGEAARLYWTGTNVAAFIYLVAFGSCWGYGSFIWLLRNAPAVRVAAFAYVNPIVAVVLGWLLVGEPLGPFVILGTLAILPGVFLAVMAQYAAAGAARAAEP